jgi:hypothetical protein
MNHSKFAITQFKNRNGSTSWRVDGRLHGVRFRKNFKTREEAAAEKSALELKAAQAAHGMQTVATSLTADQIREAEAVFQRLRSRPRSLMFYVDFALNNYKQPDQQKTLYRRQTVGIRAGSVVCAADAPHSVGNEATHRSLSHAVRV